MEGPAILISDSLGLHHEGDGTYLRVWADEGTDVRGQLSISSAPGCLEFLFGFNIATPPDSWRVHNASDLIPGPPGPVPSHPFQSSNWPTFALVAVGVGADSSSSHREGEVATRPAATEGVSSFDVATLTRFASSPTSPCKQGEVAQQSPSPGEGVARNEPGEGSASSLEPRTILSHLNEASFTVQTPTETEGLILVKIYDRFHGRQRARVLVDGTDTGIWYEPHQDRTHRWAWGYYGIPKEHLKPNETQTITIDPPSGTPLWSVGRIEVWNLRKPLK